MKLLKKLKFTAIVLSAVMVLGLTISSTLFQDNKVNAAEVSGNKLAGGLIAVDIPYTEYNPSPTVPAPAATRITYTLLLGDVDLNNEVNALDFAKLRIYFIAKCGPLPETADIDQDGSITSLDFAMLRAYLLGKIKDLGTITVLGPEVPPYIPSYTPTPTPTSTPTPIPTPKPTIKIMPLGDSITDGITAWGAYRTQLWKNIVNNGYKVDFVGSLRGGPSDLEDKDHEGHSGWRIDQISNNINSWMDTYKPDIVLLHIGTNDISQKYDLNNAPNRLSDLIDKICAKLPAGGKLYVATIIPISYADVRSYNSQVAAVVQNKANQGKPVYLVDMYSALTLSDLADGVHPNANGYNKMGDVWFNAIKNDLAK